MQKSKSRVSTLVWNCSDLDLACVFDLEFFEDYFAKNSKFSKLIEKFMEAESEVINIKKISKEEKEKIKRALKKKKNRKNKN
jgi:predicted nucleotidyltransferase